MVTFQSPKDEKDQALHARTQAADGEASTGGDRRARSILSRYLDTWVERLHYLCRPTSNYIPMLGGILALVYAFDAIQSQHVTLTATEDFRTACPEGSRRTRTSVFVKLFAASVTTLGIHGHLSSLSGSTSWKREAFRAVELLINPLASVVAFTASFWYGFVDLLMITPGSWEKRVTIKYRLARLCDCRIDADTAPDMGSRLGLAVVSPEHIKAVPLDRDLKWMGRLLVLIILSGQYWQAGVLLTRRILSDTEAGVDYAMAFLVLSGLIALFRSLIILLLNVSWSLDTEITACTEKLCHLPECIALKKGQELPSQELRIIIFGYNIVIIPITVLNELAGGFVAGHIIWGPYESFGWMLMSLWTLHVAWRSTINYALYTDGLCELISDPKEKPTDDTQTPSNQQQVGTIPLPGSSNADDDDDDASISTKEKPASDTRPPSDQEPAGILPALASPDANEADDTSISAIIFSTVLFILVTVFGLAAIAWACCCVAIQLFWLLAPSASLYYRIASETASWKGADPTKPCPQLWKDGLEDELWWF